MVECELVNNHFIGCGDMGFNRYMVECECTLMTESIQRKASFNRYMVECE